MSKRPAVTFATEQGPRDYQEDRFFYKKIEKQNCHGSLLVVLDGHIGSTVVEICVNEIPRSFKLMDADDSEMALSRLVSSLVQSTSIYFTGSTLSAACISEEKNTVSVAILGDSPIIVLDSSRCLFISPEHNVRSNQKELEAAKSRGGIYEQGYIFAKGDFNRGLQMSRSLGDAYLGDIISREPEIYTISDPVWVLVASDGIFDPNHGNQIELIVEVSELARQNASAEDVMNWAKLRGLRDNATALVWRKN